jgi:hypothetical protein
MTRLRFHWPLTVAALSLAAMMLTPAATRAGDREMETLVVDMSPNGTPTAHACFMRIRSIYAHDYTIMHGLGETAARRRAGEPGPDFMSWNREALTGLRRMRGEFNYDSIVLIDCRPDERKADVLVMQSGGNITQVRLRDTELDRRRIRWLGQRLLRISWSGFSP